jgi:hypothetical protein
MQNFFLYSEGSRKLDNSEKTLTATEAGLFSKQEIKAERARLELNWETTSTINLFEGIKT